MPGPIKKKPGRKKKTKKMPVRKITAKYLAEASCVPDCALRQFIEVFGYEAEVTASNVKKFYMHESTWNRWGEMVEFLTENFLTLDFTLTEELAEYLLDKELGPHVDQLYKVEDALGELGEKRMFEAFAQIINHSDEVTEQK